MKAFLIEANTKKIGQPVDDGLAGVKRLIGFDTVDSVHAPVWGGRSSGSRRVLELAS